MPCQRGSSGDPGKDEANQRKHGISFAQTCEPFDSGTDFLDMVDEAHSDREQRFIAVGPIPQRPGTGTAAYRRPTPEDHPRERGGGVEQ